MKKLKKKRKMNRTEKSQYRNITPQFIEFLLVPGTIYTTHRNFENLDDKLSEKYGKPITNKPIRYAMRGCALAFDIVKLPILGMGAWGIGKIVYDSLQ
jgi:hypothetical protein